ncbi:MAG: hypothetical protein M1820_002247 [Bogoriella megaspora]|nr:MAG: hypothetical protein M1820_002247 [Bogoriella megaspora]
MRLYQAEVSVVNLLLLPTYVSAITLNCEQVRAGGHTFDFSKLGGPHSVQHKRHTPPSIKNTTYTLDLCRGLKQVEHLEKLEQCQQNARVCAIEYNHNEVDNQTTITEVITMAGEFSNKNGLYLEPQYTRLKGSDSHADADKEGVRIELHGGRYPFDDRKGQKQKVFLEMICDMDRNGLEGDLGDGRVPLGGQKEEDRREFAPRATEVDLAEEPDEDNDGNEGDDERDGDEEDDEDTDRSLRWISHRTEGEDKNEIGVLRLEWRSKYACENYNKGDDKDEDDKPKGWGFFTWFIIILFLAVAAYLIFGSWLNYNRYGARGWDLLPHGDTIRDIPYIVKDWGRKAVGAVQGGGSRGSYSAL